MTSFKRVAGTTLLAAVAVAVPLAMSAAQSNAIQARKDVFQSNRTAMGQIKAVIDANGATKDAEAPAMVLIANAQKIPTLFPAGSDKPFGKGKDETAAKPDIWTKKADFDAKAAGLGKAGQTLVDAAKSGNMDQLKAAFGAAGGACKACHDDYRAT